MRLVLSLDKTLIVLGDKIKGGFKYDVAAGAVGLAGTPSNLEWFPMTGGTVPTIDMSVSTLGADRGGYSGFVTEPDPLLIAPFTGSPFTNLAFTLNFSAAGSATVIARKWWAERS